MRNKKIKFNDINGNLKWKEIDLIAYDDKNILVVECKEWRPAPKILWKYQQEYRVKDIKKEIDEKHIDRVEYIKKNYNKFGFVGNYNIKGVVITRIKENIEVYRDMKILPKYELYSFKDYKFV